MSEFTFLCPQARPDENGAHDIWEAHDEAAVLAVLYCHRCGQTMTIQEALDRTRRNPDSGAVSQ